MELDGHEEWLFSLADSNEVFKSFMILGISGGDNYA